MGYQPPYPSEPPYPSQPQYSYPQQPPYMQPQPYPPPQPPKPRGMVLTPTALAIIASVVVISLLAFLAVRPGGWLNPGNSLTGSWYGQLTISQNGPQSVVEVSGSLTQTGSSLTGTSELCFNGPKGVFVEPGYSIKGTATGTDLSLTASLDLGQPTAGSTITGSFTIGGSSAMASGQWTTEDGGEHGSWNLSIQSGQATDSQFRSACAQLPNNP